MQSKSKVVLNEEQLRAIHHNGGVLLEAGAGSGKTFVIIEHVIEIIRKFLESEEEHFIKDKRRALDLLREKLSSMVVMTFTKKAVGEIIVRLRKRVLSEIKKYQSNNQKNNQKSEQWKAVKDYLNSLTICTIHSFCYKLIKQGIFLNVSPAEEVILVAEGKNKIEKMVDDWFCRQLEITTVDFPHYKMLEVLSLNRRPLISALYDIFNDPNMRWQWHEYTLAKKENTQDQLLAFWDEFKQHQPFNILFKNSSTIMSMLATANAQTRKNQWFLLLQEFFKLLKGDDFIKIWQLITNLKRMPPLARKSEIINEELVGYWERMKELKSFFHEASNKRSFEYFFKDRKGDFLAWENLIKEIIGYIEKRYFDYKGMTFSDLEYFVLREIKKPGVLEKISKQYIYFIVDEFQDISYAQYDLLRSFINDDYKRLFAVGDIKQSIYGFRGGELQVFFNCQNAIQQKLFLKNNYRSHPSIVHFNNRFFSYLFAKGMNFSGEEDSPIPITEQMCDLLSSQSSVCCIESEVVIPEEELRISSAIINDLEAKAIAEYIRSLKAEEKSEGQVAVLYKNLLPSKYLIKYLTLEKISFTAQVKIPFAEDPVIGIFHTLLDYYLDERKAEQGVVDHQNSAQFLLQYYLGFWKVDLTVSDAMVESFFAEVKIFGIYYAFEKFLFTINLANSNCNYNIGFIETLCKISNGDLSLIRENIQKYAGDKYSIFYQQGINPQVIIMSSHMAKGLEFPHVILGGIYTNGRSKSDIGHLGKLPGSFRWTAKSGEVISLKSPSYILESIIQKNKNFSEAKRLFYVACTRAKSSLSFVKLWGRLPFRAVKNSWFIGIDKFLASIPSISVDLTLSKVKLTIPIENFPQQKSFEAKIFGSAEFLGIMAGITLEQQQQQKQKQNTPILGTTSELSVTKFSRIADCPRRFYIESICKIEEEDVELLQSIYREGGAQLATAWHDNSFKSSAKRGEELHALISKLIKHPQIPITDDTLEAKELDIIRWIYPQLSAMRSSHYAISEELIKFSLFGYMLTGIPDVVFKPKTDAVNFEVWDFKSGLRQQDNEHGYWLQLMCYAYSCYQLYSVPKDQNTILNLIYLDEKQVITKSMQESELAANIFLEWQKLSGLHKRISSHCPHCPLRTPCELGID
ncbi:MAG: UvrD-helicase domain-containing protein [Oligoflexia bacterium]|nr:UvrD-helicase domain-containing protein [Oligoflexia bacterium]